MLGLRETYILKKTLKDVLISKQIIFENDKRRGSTRDAMSGDKLSERIKQNNGGQQSKQDRLVEQIIVCAHSKFTGERLS